MPRRHLRSHLQHRFRPSTRRLQVERLEERCLLSFVTAPFIMLQANTFVLGDVNEDGKLDLATEKAIFLGNGDGTFQDAHVFNPNFSFPPRNFSGEINEVMADLNGDGHLDLAIPDPSANAVDVFLGNGDGTFQAVQRTPLPGAIFVTVGDFNGDGKQDLIVQGQSGLQILLGNGDGSFQAPIGIGPYVHSVVVGDFNGDGHLDLALIPRTYLTPGVEIWLGNGDGTFQPASSYTVGGNFLATGDFDDDGILDLAITDNLNRVTVLRGQGDGTFVVGQSYNAGDGPLVVGDFNGDGHLDLAVSGPLAHTVSLLVGQGDGTFQTMPQFGVEPQPDSYQAGQMAVGDLNNDGHPDLVVLSGSGGVTLLQGRGDGTFAPAVLAYPVPGISILQSVAMGDFNNDGVLDLAVVNGIGGGVSLLLGNGDGGFRAAQTIAAGVGDTRSFAVGDFNSDGKLDLVVLTRSGNYPNIQGTASIFLGNGDGTFRAGPSYASGYTSSGWYSVKVGDFNGDGILDFVVQNGSSSPIYQPTVSLFLGNGDGSFQNGQTYNIPLGDEFTVADMNGDGTLDLVVAYGSGYSTPGGITVLLGNGDGTFQAPQQQLLGGAFSPVFLLVADVNGDGKPDVITANYRTVPAPHGIIDYPVEYDVAVWLSSGDGTFQAPRFYQLPLCSPDCLTLADFNHDGIPDLAVSGGITYFSQHGGLAAVLLGNGDGTFQDAQVYESGVAGASFVAAGDLNGDGYADLVVGNPSLGVTVLINAADWGGGHAAIPAVAPTAGGSNQVRDNSPWFFSSIPANRVQLFAVRTPLLLRSTDLALASRHIPAVNRHAQDALFEFGDLSGVELLA